MMINSNSFTLYRNQADILIFVMSKANHHLDIKLYQIQIFNIK